MNFEQTTNYLTSLSKFGINLGLRRIAALLDKMNNPQNQLKFIHIAGTNGKGSTSTMLTNILSKSGYITGLFTSPYVLCPQECMQINGQMISNKEFAECASYVREFADSFMKSEEIPTQFEVETAIALEWYKRKNCDFVCLEVGLGGKFDSTNIIPPPIMQIITSIGLDHTNILGNTIEKIAHEKSGIIKGGITVMYPIQPKEVQTIIQKKCIKKQSSFVTPDLDLLQVTDNSWNKIEFVYDGIPFRKSLLGKFQLYNSITAITAAQQLQKLGIKIHIDDIQYGIENTYLPARMEILSDYPLIILDGAHNPDGAKSLEETLQTLSSLSITILMGVLADKDYKKSLDSIAKYAHTFIAVTPNNPRALNCKDLYKEAKKLCTNVYSYEDLYKATTVALNQLDSNSVLVICGSLYLASEIRPIILEKLKH